MTAENKVKNLADQLKSLPLYSDSVYKDTILEANATLEERLMPHLFTGNDKIPIIPFRMNDRYEKIFTELAYLQIEAVAVMGVIAILPENISNWPKKYKEMTSAQAYLKKHAENIDKGPVWDNDHWAVNYIGHSLSGSFYYVWGRQAGLTWQESTILSALMSTFFWEYGWEAFTEVPSIQDLIINPLLGSLIGEGANYLYNEIMQNNGLVYDSVILGSLSRGLLNPIGEMNKHFDNLFNAANIQISIDYSFNQNIKNFSPRDFSEDNSYINKAYFGLQFNLKY